MSTPLNSDPTQKFQVAGQATDTQAGTKPAILLLIIFAILSWFTYKDITSIVDSTDSARSILMQRVLPLHPYWLQLFFCLAAAVLLLRREKAGYVLGFGSVIFWLGSRAFFLVYYTMRSPAYLLSNAQSLLGFSFPPDLFSIANLAVNILCVSTLAVLNLHQFKNAMGVTAAQQRSAMVFALVFTVYGLICYFMVDILDPAPSPPAFNF